jgi:hypothetical protein
VNGRGYRYFINNMPVYSGAVRTQPVLQDAVGARIEIRGKIVDLGSGPEIWTATLTACR